MQDFKETRKGMHITEYKHVDFDWFVENAIGFHVTSQFDGDSLDRSTLIFEPECATGQQLWAVMSAEDSNDIEYHRIYMLIDSSD